LKLKLLAAGIALALMTTAAHAGTVLTDNFDGENGGNTFLQYTGFANFNVTGTGVDIVRTGDFGITCAGGSGSCVDLDGSPGPGGVITKNTFNFSPGELVTMTFQIAGNQRSGDANSFFAGFEGSGTLKDYSIGGFWGNADVLPGPLPLGLVETETATTGGNQPFETYTLSFETLGSGSFQAFIGTNDPGNVGPLLDNFSLSINPVPEPATWAMMVLGLGLVGGGLRMSRRRSLMAPIAV
jgi:hypothetical protein